MTLNRVHAMIMMVIGSVALSFSGLLVRSFEGATPDQINFYRSVALIGVILIVYVVRSRLGLSASKKAVGWQTLAGGLVLAGAGICALQALLHTSVANTVLIVSTTPFIATILGYSVLKEVLSGATLWALAIAAVGVCVMMFGDIDGAGASFGNLMALATASGYAVYAVLLRLGSDVDMLPSLPLAAALIAVYSFFSSMGDLAISTNDLILCLIWGGILSGIANLLLIFASHVLKAGELTMFTLLEVAVAPTLVWIFYRETPGVLAVIGGLLIVGSITTRGVFEYAAESASAPELSDRG